MKVSEIQRFHFSKKSGKEAKKNCFRSQEDEWLNRMVILEV